MQRNPSWEVPVSTLCWRAPPRGLVSVQQAWASSPWAWYQSAVHSQTLPIMSCRP
jgi:hypothetical protein